MYHLVILFNQGSSASILVGIGTSLFQENYLQADGDGWFFEPASFKR